MRLIFKISSESPRSASIMRMDDGQVSSSPQSSRWDSAGSSSPLSSALSSPPSSPSVFETPLEVSPLALENSPTSNDASPEAVSSSVAANTEITSDTDSQPSDEEFLALVKFAQSKGDMPKSWNPTVVKLINGKWTAPGSCDSCKLKKSNKCDRGFPCTTCTKQRRECSQSVLIDTKVAKITVLSMSEENSVTEQKPARSATKKRRSQSAEFIPLSDSDQSPEDDDDFKPVLPAKRARTTRKQSGSDQDSPEDTEEQLTKGQMLARAKIAAIQAGKPEPFGQPLVWGDKRQQICETLPYYRAYQSGAYTHGGVLYGFMIDKEVGVRDQFNDQVIISRVGGGRVADEDGNMIQTKDQSNIEKCASALAARKTMEKGLAVGLIAGQGNPLAPSKLPHYYNVLDWFHVTDVWNEEVNGAKTWMVRFEKVDLNSASWWAPVDFQFREPDLSLKAESHQCPYCTHPSKTIFKIGWTCLYPSCKAYFMVDVAVENIEFREDINGEQFVKFEERIHGQKLTDSDLEYRAEFMNERTIFRGQISQPLSPTRMTNADLSRMGAFGVEAVCKKGIVCAKCGCCIRRKMWHQWSCENTGCDFTYSLDQSPVSPSQAIVQGANNMIGTVKELVGENIVVRHMDIGGYSVKQYNFPNEHGHIIGFVSHFKATGRINQQVNGPNDIFMELQTAADRLKLMRNACRGRGSAQETLTAHWAANWGAPYKFIVSHDSTPFSNAPEVIIKAVKRLTWAGNEAVTGEGEEFRDFNELLSVGYFEDSYMGYHDDGESTLGPTVASLSLGAQSVMSFRPKGKGPVNPSEGKTNQKGTKQDVLRIILDHGDIMVMHGAQIQKLYEHAVNPHGKLRFALTCRYIRPETLKGIQEQAAALTHGLLPPSSDQFNYDGDSNALPIDNEDKLSEQQKLINSIKAMLQTGIVNKADLMAQLVNL